MKSLFSWLLTFFMVMFWVFRIIVTLSAQFGSDFGGFIVFNNTIEIALLFISILAFILIVKRNIFGALIYLAGYGYYFGTYIYSNAIVPLINEETLEFVVIQNVVVAAIGLVIGLCILLDITIERARKKHYSDQKTDWFFDNENFDRKLDDRADKNNYRTM